MIKFKALLCFVILFDSTLSGEIVISGHESPLIVGHPRDIGCRWSGETPLKMEWCLIGLDAMPMVSENDTSMITLTLDSYSGLNGTRFGCRVTLPDAAPLQRNVTIVVKELTNRVEIQAPSADTAVAGQPFQLTCIIVSDMQPQITWEGPNQNFTYQNSNEVDLRSTVTFDLLHTSDGGIYTCVSSVKSPHSKQEATYSLIVHMPPPNVTVTRQPEYPAPLFPNSHLMLKCIVQLIPEIDIPVAVHSQWSGHSSLSDPNRVNVTDLKGAQGFYLSMSTFFDLDTEDSGSYSCSAYVGPANGTSAVQQSPSSSDTLDIHISLSVEIIVTYDPPLDFALPSPPYYRSATKVTFTCTAPDSVGYVSYQWSSTCSSCFASSSESQSIFSDSLQPSDAGVHTCTVTDESGKTGSNFTEIILMGTGISVSRGIDPPHRTDSNNSILISSYCCSYKIQVYCYSNSTITSTSSRSLVWPDGRIYENNVCHYCEMCMDITSYPSGMYIKSYYSSHPGTGVYTCRLPDSNGKLLDLSFAVYMSMPSAPNITTLEYNISADLTVANITCLTEVSPPTHVTWMMDGSILNVYNHNENYSFLQVVTNRKRVHYRNTLVINNALIFIGTHTITCVVTNIAGNDSMSIVMHFPVTPVMKITSSNASMLLKETSITCSAYVQGSTLFSSLAVQLLSLEWTSLNGISLDGDDSITLGPQVIINNTVVKNLIIDPVNYAHSGLYQCTVTLDNGQNNSITANTSYTITVYSQALFQIKFGPFTHCTQWYHDEGISLHLEKDIKSTLIEFINSKYSRSFPLSVIDESEFSCQTTSSSITYRARITGSENTVTAPALLRMMQDWVSTNGTLLYTYPVDLELKVDPRCTLEIDSFSEPECKTGNIIITGHKTPVLVGESRQIVCSWTGRIASKMEWYLHGLNTIPIETITNSNTVVLSPDPGTIALDGAMFTCRVTIGQEEHYDETITLFIQGSEHSISVEASGPAIVGVNFTLTCTVFSDKPVHIIWEGPNGVLVTRKGILISPKVISGLLSTVKLTIDEVKTSQAGVYTCISVMKLENSTKSKTFFIKPTVPPPKVTITRNPDSHKQLYTTSPMVLTCTIELDSAVDSSVSVKSRWNGHSALFDGGKRVILSDLEGVHPYYESIVNFTSLRSEDAGEYTCLADILSLDEPPLFAPISYQAQIVLDIALKVNISINYTRPFGFTLQSPPYYRPASYVNFTCHAHGAIGAVTYSWSSTCSSCAARGSTSQSVSTAILTSNDAGIHTCTIRDSTGCSGSSSTEVILKGYGMYVTTSDLQTGAISNNSIVIIASYRGGYCPSVLQLYCYSDVALQNVGFVTAYDGYTYSTGSHNYMTVAWQNPAGLYLHYRQCSRSYVLPSGVYTCTLPTSDGESTDFSVAIFKSPYELGSPVVETITFKNLLSNDSSELTLAEVTCNTKQSPPTNVTWLRDGNKIDTNSTLYQTAVKVVNRKSFCYEVTLVIRDIRSVGGVHTYTCIIKNTQGEDRMSITTDVSVISELSTFPLSEPLDGQNFTLECAATLYPKLRQLFPYLFLKWVHSNEQSMQNNIIFGIQSNLSDQSASRPLHFHPITSSRSGVYVCNAVVDIPNSVGDYAQSSTFSLDVLNRTYIQLKFGPIIHCSVLYKNKEMATHLKNEVSHMLADVIREKCKCELLQTMTDQETLSCHTTTSLVVYRARITGDTGNGTTLELMAWVQDWLSTDGTFLHTYHSRIRLRLDPECPLEIASLSEPECI